MHDNVIGAHQTSPTKNGEMVTYDVVHLHRQSRPVVNIGRSQYEGTNCGALSIDVAAGGEH